jgi:hypothetical protein
MAGHINNIPARAVLIGEIRKVIPEGGRKGQRYHATRHQVGPGYADAGTEYLAIRVGRIRTPERIATSWRYSGNRIRAAQSDWEAWVRDTAGWPDWDTI